MPSTEEHVEISRQRTGKDHRELHEWMDADPGKKVERHDVNRICEYGQLMKALYGEEGLEEYVQHIYDDVIARYLRGKTDLESAILAQTAFFALKSTAKGPDGDACRVKASDVDLLRQAGVSEGDIAHSIQVAQKALELAERTGADLDKVLVGRGALLHDLGKAKGRGHDHGIFGGEIGRKMGLPDAITTIMEKHVNAGLTEEEAHGLGLPRKDYSPNTIEEKIVIYADKLVDIITASDRIVATEHEAEERFPEILKTHPNLAKGDKPLSRHLQYHEEIQGLTKAR
ncbi:MAG: HDIG domain-containing protein [Desulfomonile tiedjei]|nr:HDIG domain-containing protein [Desulfomonile tiedjei]